MSVHPNTFKVICSGAHPQLSGEKSRRQVVPALRSGSPRNGVLICVWCDGVPQDKSIIMHDVPTNISEMVP